MSYIIKCDRCSETGGHGARGQVPQGWVELGIDTKVTGAGGTYRKYHQFCPKCVAHLQLGSDITEKTSAEKLVAIIESMVD